MAWEIMLYKLQYEECVSENILYNPSFKSVFSYWGYFLNGITSFRKLLQIGFIDQFVKLVAAIRDLVQSTDSPSNQKIDGSR